MEDWTNIANRQPILTEQDKTERDLFISEYFKDYDMTAAILRMGYNPKYADHMGKQFMLDSYVLSRIEERKRKEFDVGDMKVWLTNQLMSSAVHPSGSNTSKVLALKTLMDLHGLSGPAKPKIKDDNPGGVMKVPAERDVEQWEMEAMKLQSNLKKDVASH